MNARSHELPKSRLRFVADINPRTSLPPDLGPEDEVCFLPMEAVGEGVVSDLGQRKAIREIQAGYTAFRKNDVVVAKITPCFENGKGALLDQLPTPIGFGTTELHVLRVGPLVQPRYLSYITQSVGFRDGGTAEMYGAGGQKRVPDGFLRNYVIDVLPAEIQQAVVAFLDRKMAAIDALIANKERQIDLLREKRHALITQAVTKGLDPNVPMKDSGIRWLGDIPAHWEVHQLRRVVREFVDYRGRTPTKVDDGVPLITAGAVRDGRIDHARAPEYMAVDEYTEFMRRGLPELGDLVFTSEAPLGEVALVEDPSVAFAQRIILFRVNRTRMLSEFLWLYYRSDAGRAEVMSRASGSTAEGIRADRLRGSLVLVPPVTEQHEIIETVKKRLEHLGPISMAVATQIDRLREYRQALISAAVTGKIEIPVEEAA